MIRNNGENDGRETNYDLLRIISTIAVIVIHVNATYQAATTDANILGGYMISIF